MRVEKNNNPPARLEPAKMIVCMLPDDGTDLKIMHRLRKEKYVTRAVSAACRGVDNLQTARTRLGKLPEPLLGRILTVIVSRAEADDVFELVYGIVQVDQPGRGALVQITLSGASSYVLPDDVPEETPGA